MKYFYFDSVSLASVKSQDAIEGNVDEILHTWSSLSKEDGSFLGLYTSSGHLLQCMWSDRTSVLLDIPQRDRGGSMIKSTKFDEVCILIKCVFDGLHPDQIEGLKFSSWV